MYLTIYFWFHDYHNFIAHLFFLNIGKIVAFGFRNKYNNSFLSMLISIGTFKNYLRKVVENVNPWLLNLMHLFVGEKYNSI